jgi:hypothetical protein
LGKISKHNKVSKKYFIDNLTLLKFFIKMREWTNTKRRMELLGMDLTRFRKYKSKLANFYKFKNESVKEHHYFDCNPCIYLDIEPQAVVLKATSEILMENFEDEATNTFYNLASLKKHLDNF